jgi:hypothetical protein
MVLEPIRGTDPIVDQILRLKLITSSVAWLRMVNAISEEEEAELRMMLVRTLSMLVNWEVFWTYAQGIGLAREYVPRGEMWNYSFRLNADDSIAMLKFEIDTGTPTPILTFLEGTLDEQKAEVARVTDLVHIVMHLQAYRYDELIPLRHALRLWILENNVARDTDTHHEDGSDGQRPL